MHTPGAHVSKSMHPAAKMCPQAAGGTFNFEHCKQFSKLSIYFVHTLGAEGHRIVHPAALWCAQAYIVKCKEIL